MSLVVTMHGTPSPLQQCPSVTNYELMHYLERRRDWQSVERFHHALVAGTARLSEIGLQDAGVVLTHTPMPHAIPDHHTHTHAAAAHAPLPSNVLCDPFGTACLQPPHPSGRHGPPPKRTTFVAQVAYRGGAFSGWAVQPDPVRTVQGTVQRALTQRLHPRGGRGGATIQVAVAGRTDSGVHACAQLLSLHTFGKDSCEDVLRALNEADPPNVVAAWVACVPRTFHPVFQARWRRYVYLLPLRGAADTVPPPTLWRAPPQPVDVELVDALPELQAVSLQRVLRPLVGQSLDFTALSRALEEGKDPMCTLYRAEVHAVTLPTAPGSPNALAVELVGNRFLRRMIRVLVTTAVQQVLCGGGEEAMVRVLQAGQGSPTPAAPATGLSFCGCLY